MTTRTRCSFLLLAAAISSACRSRDDRRALPTARDVAARPVLPAPTSPATAADLARELDEADRRGTWSDVKTRWLGRRVAWTVTRHRVLCGNADACHVAAFQVERPARRGWLPGLAFAPGAYAALEAACHGDPCEVAVAGTVSELVASPELPQSVKLSDVTVVGEKLASAR
jgi:hypothetical protein